MSPARAALLLGILSACNPVEMSRAREVADQGVVGFHEQYNAGRFAEIVSGLGDGFPASDREKFAQLLGTVHRKLGNATESKSQSWNVTSNNFRTNVRLVQATTFEHGTGVETFIWLVSGGQARLIGYNINSVDLILR